MGTTDNAEARSPITAFLQALQGLGWTEGRNVQIDLRWAVARRKASRRRRAS